MLEVRRYAALAVLILAGLVSLATSEPYFVEDHAEGRILVGPNGATIGVLVQLGGIGNSASASGSQTSGLDFQVLGDGASAVAATVEFQVIGPTDTPEMASWVNTPVTAPLPIADCAPSCTLDFSINLRLRQPATSPIVVPWRVHAIEFSDVGSLKLTVSAPPNAESLTDTELPALGVGFAAGLLVLIALAVAGPKASSRLAMLELIAGVALVTSGLFVGQGLVVGPRTGWLGLLSVVAGGALLWRLLTRTPRMSRASYWAVPIGLVTLPIAFGGFVVSGEFRPSDAIAIFGTIGLVSAVALAELVFYFRPVIVTLPQWQMRNWLVLISAAVTLSISLAWVLLISAGATGLSVFVAVPFGMVYLGQVAGLAIWMHGRSTESIVFGILIALGAAVQFVAMLAYALSNLFFDGFSGGPALVMSCAVVAVCGLLFAIFGSYPLRLSTTAGHDQELPRS